jgi:quinol monooxygenase YgiN
MLCHFRPEEPMPQVALLAEFEVKAQDLELFLAAAKRELEAVRGSEPGCLGFDVVLFDEEVGRGAFVEVFEDQAAADAHRDTPHFTAFFDEIAEIDVTWSVRRGTALSAN